MFYSCTEDEELFLDLNKSENHLVFENYEDYFQTIKKSLNMDLNELVVWQQKRGVYSKSIKALQIYYDYDFEAVNNESELYKFLDENSDYLHIIEFEGEKYIEPINYNKNNRFILNDLNLIVLEIDS